MDLITVRELYRNKESYLDKNITVGGWVRSIRDSKTFGFIVLNDGTFFETLQIVYDNTLNNFAEISKLNVGSAIIVSGKLVATPQAKQPSSRRSMCRGCFYSRLSITEKETFNGIFAYNYAFTS